MWIKSEISVLMHGFGSARFKVLCVDILLYIAIKHPPYCAVGGDVVVSCAGLVALGRRQSFLYYH